MSRRAFLAASGIAAGTAALSACGSSGKTASSTPSQLEVFSWLTAGGEKNALEALVADFSYYNPHITFVNRAVAGGAGTNAKVVLAQRLKAGNPPDTFQGHAGAELHDYITAGQLEDLSFLYQQQGWSASFNQQVLPLIQKDGKYYSVPVDIHHINMLWSSQKLCDTYKVSSQPATVGEWLDNLAKIKHNSGGKVAALATSEEWANKQILETMLLSVLGPSGYNALWKSGSDWGSTHVAQAIAYFDELLSYSGTYNSNLTWDQATNLVGTGKAAYQVMGDWAEANLKAGSLFLTPQVDYNWTPVPGTQGAFLFASDSFTLPKGAKNRDATIAWLTECGSKHGQDYFNTVKGAIPPRASVDATESLLYDQYLRWSLNQWGTAKVVGSLTHGVVANNSWNGAIDTAVTTFLADRQRTKLQDALEAAAKTNAV